MPEQLLTSPQVARRLGISLRHFYRLRHALMAKGLRPVMVGGMRKFTESSLDKLITEAAEMETALC